MDIDSRTDAATVERVQSIDLENAMFLPPGQCVKGAIVGDENWGSPEACCCGELSKSTDIFSFGAVVSGYHSV